jgi:DNA-cytosine methyltransferase
MTVLSLFDGMGCGRLALDRLGITPENYYASEIDAHAIRIASKNFPDIKHIGDVRYVSDIKPRPYLLIGGSPCQGFSFAGAGLNFDDPRSKLFFEFVRLKEMHKPLFFLLENVRMKKNHQDIISGILGTEPILINSALVSAQKRNRLYWTNIIGITQPAAKSIVLRDILETEGICVTYDNRNTPEFTEEEISTTLTASYGKGMDYHGQRTLVYLTEEEVNKAKKKHSKQIWKTGRRMGTVQFPTNKNGKSKCLTATIIKCDRSINHIEDAGGIRLLTPVECERLQTLPDNYTAGVSNSQRYRMIGNGWNVDTIVHILSFMPRPEDFCGRLRHIQNRIDSF